eukprot:TRINITY_DN4477_c0_g3_i1.p1 TRINITY_DN4477_c0_g3~~TRINITY_DN4477_c0_g3_i1.p1  ORF type:complete len:374 (+),score=21.70 TRINITY_DN4477_c0_g3_i1:269-1390(+)
MIKPEPLPIFYTFKLQLKTEAIPQCTKLLLKICSADRSDKPLLTKLIHEFSVEIRENLATKAIQLEARHGKGPIELTHAVLSVVLPRVDSWISRQIGTLPVGLLLGKIAALCEQIKMLVEVEDVNKAIYSPYILIASRALLDEYPGAMDTIEYLGPIREIVLDLDQDKRYQKAKALFDSTLNTELSKHCLGKFIETYKLKITIKEAQEILRFLTRVFVVNKVIGGMTGFSRMIAIERSIFILSTPESFEARFVGLSYHEGGHILLREGLGDYFASTPPSKIIVEGIEFTNLESGYCLESLLFGHYDCKYWNATFAPKIVNLESWKTTSPILSEEIKKGGYELRGLTNVRQSAFCEETLYSLAEQESCSNLKGH